MSKADIPLTLLVVLVGTLVFAVLVPWPRYEMRMVPQCQEDQVLIGTGDFEDGRWSSYRCGPAVDDFAVDMSL